MYGLRSLYLLTPKLRGQANGGFAVVLALALMAFVLILLISLTAFVRVEVWSAETGIKRMEAEQAALLALNVAIGELQKAAGPDQRVTATAGLLSSAAVDGSTDHYTGVWNSDPNTAPTSPFLRWLVSSSDRLPGQGIFSEDWISNGQPIDASASYSVNAAQKDDFVLLVGNGSVDAASATSTLAVVAEKMSHMVGGTERKYAWWVGDEGVKAKVNLGGNRRNLNFGSTDLADLINSANNLSGSPRSGLELVASDLAAFSDVLTDSDLNSSVELLSGFSDLRALDSSIPSQTVKAHFHDLTFASHGLLTNPVRGGFKEDLSLAFEYGIKDSSSLSGDDAYLYTDTYAHPDAGSVNLRGPRWDILQEYYQSYRRLNYSGDIPSVFMRKGNLTGELSGAQADDFNTNIDFYDDPVVRSASTTIDGAASGAIPRATSAPMVPVVLGSKYYLGLNIGSSPVAQSHDRDLYPVQITGNPVAVLWNPYNVTLEIDPSGPEFSTVFTNNFQIGISVVHRYEREKPLGSGEFEYTSVATFPYGREENKSSGYMTTGALTTSPPDPDIWGPPYTNTSGGVDRYWDTASLAEIYRQNTTGVIDSIRGFQSALTLAPSFSMAPGEIIVISSAADALSNNERVMSAQEGFPDYTKGWVLENIGRRVSFDPATGFEEWELDSDGNYIYDTHLATFDWSVNRLHAGEYQSVGFGTISTSGDIEYASLRVTNIGMNADYDPTDDSETRGSASNYRLGEAHLDLGGEYPSSIRGRNNNLPTSLALYESSTMAAEDIDDTNTSAAADYYDPQRATPSIQRPLEMFLFHSPRAPYGGPNHSSFVGQNRMPYELAKFSELQPDVPFPNGVDPNWGEYGDFGGYSRLVAWDVPRLPLTSIGQLQHAPIERFAYEPSYSIGNSYASPYIEDTEKVSTQSYFNEKLGRTVYGSSVDTSYYANEALWDNFFFSSLAPRLESGGDFSTLTDVISAFVSRVATQGPANNRMRFYQPSGETAEAIENTLNDMTEASQQAAKYLTVEGAFNINSVSVDAWKAFLSGLNQIPVATAQLIGNSLDFESSPDVAFSRFSTPVRSNESSPGENDYWEAYRILDAGDIDTLANEIVDQIKDRDRPFLSLAEFINRNPSDAEPEDRRAGLLQRAIDLSGLNDGLANSGAQNDKTGGTPGLSFLNSAAGPGLTGAGAPGYLLQGDLLNSLGPMLTNRSNTFRIRTYGESLGLSGDVSARVYLEAIVQQVPEYVDPSDAPEEVEGDLTAINQAFGRKFKVVSLRWLNEEDV